MTATDISIHTSLSTVLTDLDRAEYRFRTQATEGDEYVPATEIMSDLRHGDMAEMLARPTRWNTATSTVTAIVPDDAIEASGAQIRFQAALLAGSAGQNLWPFAYPSHPYHWRQWLLDIDDRHWCIITPHTPTKRRCFL